MLGLKEEIMNADEHKKQVTIVTEGKEEERDLSGLLEGEEFIYLGRCRVPYLWQGEERIEYEEQGGFHTVNGKVYGVDLDKVDIESITDPADILGVDLSGEHLRYLSNFPGVLALAAHYVEQNQMMHLAEASRLKSLDLGLNRGVTDEGLSHVAGLSDLRWINLLKTPITDAGLAHLAGLVKLSILWLSDTRITGAGLKHLAGLGGLEQLGLAGTGVSDSELPLLASLTNLKYLDIRSTKISEEGVRELKKSLPGCKISV
jgi:hypothetical protein